MEMRQALEEKEDAKSLKQKTRERVRPKMGKLTIDYQKLHDAFFRSHDQLLCVHFGPHMYPLAIPTTMYMY